MTACTNGGVRGTERYLQLADVEPTSEGRPHLA